MAENIERSIAGTSLGTAAQALAGVCGQAGSLREVQLIAWHTRQTTFDLRDDQPSVAGLWLRDHD